MKITQGAPGGRQNKSARVIESVVDHAVGDPVFVAIASEVEA